MNDDEKKVSCTYCHREFYPEWYLSKGDSQCSTRCKQGTLNNQLNHCSKCGIQPSVKVREKYGHGNWCTYCWECLGDIKDWKVYRDRFDIESLS